MNNQATACIIDLADEELDLVTGGATAAAWLTFGYIGAVAATEWMIEKAYDAGRWVGRNS